MAKKTLFKTPCTEPPAINNNDELQSLMKKIEVEMQVESNFKNVQKELHEKRLEQMKKILEDSKTDDWKYDNIDELLSF